jgi:hypothetical protein
MSKLGSKRTSIIPLDVREYIPSPHSDAICVLNCPQPTFQTGKELNNLNIDAIDGNPKIKVRISVIWILEKAETSGHEYSKNGNRGSIHLGSAADQCQSGG